MFDFRYHALSLMAVFIALAVGLLLGVAIGDEELVSSAKDDVRDSLRGDVREANRGRDDARSDLSEQREFVEEAFPILVGGQLRARSIGVVLLGEDDPDTVRDVDDALEPTGADVDLVAVVDREVDRTELSRRAADTRYAALGRDPELLEDFGRRLGVQMVEGGRLVGRVREELMSSLSGTFGGLDGVVVVRTPGAEDEPEDAAARREQEQAREEADALHDGIARGLADTGVPASGVERREADPSQIGWYRDRGLSSVDNVDETAGRAALVYVLAGAEGRFGRKDSAQALLPPVVASARRP